MGKNAAGRNYGPRKERHLKEVLAFLEKQGIKPEFPSWPGTSLLPEALGKQA
jgi:hypothetical protein